MKILVLLLLALPAALAQTPAPGPSVVKIVERGAGFQLLVDGKSYVIKGAVGSDYPDKLKRYGGNSIRAGSKPQVLDQARALGLMVLVNLPVQAERDGMDYNDAQAVRRQHEKVLDIVRRTRNHPAVLMWALGNELDFIQANVKEHYNEKVWDAVEALARDIHRLDPDHPVMTVVGSIDEGKIKTLAARCPGLDLLGVNEYGDLLQIPGWLRTFGWQKPYAVTEWGPTGFWQVPETPWKAPVEETSSMKADKYRERYAQAIAADTALCLGSFVFLWRQHQERTHTWFGMFDAAGRETEAVDVMHHAWTGRWPANRTPRLDSVKLDGHTAYDGVYLRPGHAYAAQAWVRDPEGETLRYHWEVLPEGTRFPYGGNNEPRLAAVPGLLAGTNRPRVDFRSPAAEGPYRLFVYAYDGHGHWATANIPFYVRK